MALAPACELGAGAVPRIFASDPGRERPRRPDGVSFGAVVVGNVTAGVSVRAAGSAARSGDTASDEPGRTGEASGAPRPRAVATSVLRWTPYVATTTITATAAATGNTLDGTRESTCRRSRRTSGADESTLPSESRAKRARQIARRASRGARSVRPRSPPRSAKKYVRVFWQFRAGALLLPQKKANGDERAARPARGSAQSGVTSSGSRLPRAIDTSPTPQ